MLRSAYWMLRVIIIITSVTTSAVVICKRGSLAVTSPYPNPCPYISTLSRVFF